MQKTINLNFDEVKLIKGAKNLILDPEQADMLVELLKAKNELEQLVEQVSSAIAEAGEKLDPTFKGIKSEKFNLMFRVYGSRFAIDPAFEDQIPDKLVERVMKTSLNTKAVEQYFEEVGELPIGIVERERAKKASLKLKEQDEN